MTRWRRVQATDSHAIPVWEKVRERSGHGVRANGSLVDRKPHLRSISQAAAYSSRAIITPAKVENVKANGNQFELCMDTFAMQANQGLDFPHEHIHDFGAILGVSGAIW